VRYAFADGKKFELKEAKPGEGEKPTVNVTRKWELSVEGQMGMRLTIDFSQEEAIRMLTINPAKIFGVADRLGSIEVGKDADFLIATGDPLDMKTEVKQLVINGRAIDMSNWWETFYDKFRKRPEK
jgi:predicted amidohydrolase YtcJ